MHTLKVLSIFLLGTSLGCLALLVFVPFKTIGSRFYRFFGFLAGAFTLTYGIFNYTQITPIWVGTMLILVTYMVAMTYKPSPLGIKVLFPLSILSLLLFYLEKTAAFHLNLFEGPLDLYLAQINFISSAILIGATLNSMILGHWYLVEPKLSIKPFMVLTWAFIGALGLRLLVICGSLLYYWQILTGDQKWELKQLLAIDGELVFLIQRVLFGILLPVMLSYFIWNTVKIRATQSATGILYVTVVFIFIGELIGIHLTLRTGFLM